MVIKTQVSELLNTRMNRQDFLKRIAIGIVALTGISAMLNLLTSQQQAGEKDANSGGYGSSAYGAPSRDIK